MAAQNTGWRLAGLGLGWLAGAALQLQERSLLPLAAYAGLLCAGVVALALAWRWRRAFAFGLLGMALLGFALTGGRATLRLADGLTPALEGQDIVVQGIVASLPLPGAGGLRFRLQVESAQLQGHSVTLPRLLALGWQGCVIHRPKLLM